jgi:DNA repair photolyase
MRTAKEIQSGATTTPGSDKQDGVRDVAYERPQKTGESAVRKIAGLHSNGIVIAPNNFISKSLSCWSVNPALGCAHGCGFCYVPDTSAGKQRKILAGYGVSDANKEWGSYVIVRPLDEGEFLRSLKAAENTPLDLLNIDGNRAVMFSTTTDPYQAIKGDNADFVKRLNLLMRSNVRRALELIRDHSTLNVRILTRSRLAERDFDIYQSFQNRLLLGTSLPTVDQGISSLYEPDAPAPKQRVQLLLNAHLNGIPTYVAIAPVFPEVAKQGMLDVFNAVKAANPLTYFMEPINIRDGIANRINERAMRTGGSIDLDLFKDRKKWARYAIQCLRDAETAAAEAGVSDRLHLWPDHSDLQTEAVLLSQEDPRAYLEWLNRWWRRVSEWPGKAVERPSS